MRRSISDGRTPETASLLYSSDRVDLAMYDCTREYRQMTEADQQDLYTSRMSRWRTFAPTWKDSTFSCVVS